MHLDAEMLDAGPSIGHPLVRFYRWSAPTLSIGATLPLPPEVATRCERNGIDVVVRPTGGGAVLHRGDVTYAVIAPCPSESVLDTYRWVAGPLIDGLSRLGLAASISVHPGRARALDCFALPTGADLEVDGRKVCGSAQVRRNGWFLQHGSIPVTAVSREVAALLGTQTDDAAAHLGAWVPGLTQQAVIAALTEGFIYAWGEPLVDLAVLSPLPNPLLLL